MHSSKAITVKKKKRFAQPKRLFTTPRWRTYASTPVIIFAERNADKKNIVSQSFINYFYRARWEKREI